MRKVSLLLCLAAAAVAGILISGCGQSQPPTIKIGLAGVLSGSDAAIGTSTLNGAQVAIDEWNARATPGVLGKKIDGILLDDEGKPDKAVTVAQQLVDDGVAGVIGHFNSGCTLPASRVYADGKIVEITPASTNPQITEQGFPYLFRACGRDDQQGTTAGSYLRDTLHLNKIAILHDKTAYGQGLATEVQKTFTAKGGQVVMFQGIGKDDRDFLANIAVIKSSGADGFFWGGMYDQGGALCEKMREEGLTIPFASGEGCFDQSFINAVGGNMANVYISFGPDYRQMPAAQPFLKAYQDKFHVAEGGYSIYGYVATEILLQAIDKTQSTDPDKIAAYIKATSFDTILGPIQFDSNGDVKGSHYVIWTVKDGKFEVIPGQS